MKPHFYVVFSALYLVGKLFDSSIKYNFMFLLQL